MTEENGYAEGWKPQPGDTVKGTVVALDATDAGYGAYPIVTLRRDDGTEAAVHCFHTVLKQEIIDLEPAIGDPLEVTYVGRKGDGGNYGKGYESYRVRGKKKAFSWDRFASLGEPRQDAAVASAAPPIEPAPVPTVTEAAPAPALPASDEVPF